MLRDELKKLEPVAEKHCRDTQWNIDRSLQRVLMKLEMKGMRYDARTSNGLHDDPLRDASSIPD